MLTHLKNKKRVSEKYLAYHFLGIQEFLGKGGLGGVYWPFG